MAHGKTAFRRVLMDLHTANNEAHGELPFSGYEASYEARRVTRELFACVQLDCNWTVTARRVGDLFACVQLDR